MENQDLNMQSICMYKCVRSALLWTWYCLSARNLCAKDLCAISDNKILCFALVSGRLHECAQASQSDANIFELARMTTDSIWEADFTGTSYFIRRCQIYWESWNKCSRIVFRKDQ